MYRVYWWVLGLCLLTYACGSDTDQNQDRKTFELVSTAHSGIHFVNTLVESVVSNYYQYMYTYLGGGVAAGDINNDGLVDLFLGSNSHSNRLYLNKGDLHFEDITLAAGLSEHEGFHTGVSMVDFNHDGYLDIYICRGGWKNESGAFKNLLYVNNGDLTFTEQAEQYGLADANRGIQAVFFDYDHDEDLDVYISNTPDITGRAQVTNLDSVHRDEGTLSLLGSDRLYQNNGQGYFKDVSQQSGLLYDIGFGLNPIAVDLNDDGWLDIYVCNDFNGPDLAYVNNQDGTFTESIQQLFRHISFNSMGCDVADINNDGRQDLMTLDMNPEDYVRSKTTMAMTSIPTFEAMVAQGYHHQYMHNMLQLNWGNGVYSEISKMAGMGDTDWSWAILSADFDLDGYADVFVTNGVYRDVIDRDKNNEILQILRSNQRKPTPEDFLAFAQMLPQQKLNNYFFKNNGDLTFRNVSTAWADTMLSFSNGAIYSDLDNDGDLDLVVNNINDTAFVLENKVEVREKNYLTLSFKGPDKNPFAVGVTAKLHLQDQTLIRQLSTTRGFLSSVDHRLHFGINNKDSVESLEIIWPDKKTQRIADPPLNTSLEINYLDAGLPEVLAAPLQHSLFTKVASEFQHRDPYFNDYDLQILLPHKLSQTGPAVAIGDVNQDGWDDAYLGGGTGQAGFLILGNEAGGFDRQQIPSFESDQMYEDQGACFFDINGDGHLDLYVSSGSYEFYFQPRFMVDRVYLGDGKGNFERSSDVVPELSASGSVVKAADWDRDGDMDVFVGGRVIPGEYPYPPTSYLLQNESGKLVDRTDSLAPQLRNIGMVTDAVWASITNSDRLDLVLTGEWMGIEVFENSNQDRLDRSSAYPTLQESRGWWNRLYIADVDMDGDQDIIAGNLGLNYKFHASPEKPFKIYTSDFDFNGVEDVVLAKEYDGREVPVRGKTCMTQQIPHLANKIPTYQQFASAELSEIVGNLDRALSYEATEFRSGIFIRQDDASYHFEPFEHQLQISPVNGILLDDFDQDGKLDLLLAGNNHMSEVETTRADAGVGFFLKGKGGGAFEPLAPAQSGFFAPGDVRNLVALKSVKEKIFVINNNSIHDIFEITLPKM